MRVGAKTLFLLFGVVLARWLWGTSLRVRANDDDRSIEGAWRITISSPPDCQASFKPRRFRRPFRRPRNSL